MSGLTRENLRDYAKQRTDNVGASFVSDAEWNVWLDEAASELHDLILQSDEKAVSDTENIAVVAGTEGYALPSDFHHVLGVFMMNGSVREYPLRRFNLHEIGYAGTLAEVTLTRGLPYAYDLVGTQIWLYPLPNAARTVQLLYAAAYSRFTGESDTLDYPVVNGWEQFVVVTAAIKALMKEESDVSAFLAEKQVLTDRITRQMAGRDAFEARQVRDVYGSTERFRRYGRRGLR